MTSIAKPPAPQKPAAPSRLRMDDVIDLLQSDEAIGKIDEIKGQLGAHGLPLDKGVKEFHLAEPKPVDQFEALVMTALKDNFLRQSELVATIPAAVTYALAHAADADGNLSAEAVTKAFGPRGAELYRWLDQKLEHGARTIPTQRRLLKYAHLPPSVLEQIAKSASTQDLEARMPVLAEVTRMMGGVEKLAGLRMAAVQHLFPTTTVLFDQLAGNGLDPTQTLIYGKNYSTNLDVMYQMRVAGWDVPTLSATKLVTVDENGQDREVSPIGGYLQKMLQGLDPVNDVGPKVLLLDEGGKLLKALHEHFPEYAHLCVAVEQTDRGIQVIEEMKAHGIELKCPVVSVARSEAKKKMESPMIGESVAHSIDNAVAGLHPDLKIEPKVATIIGYGAVGKATADALRRRGFAVNVFDTDPAKMEAARADGCTPMSREEALKNAHLLVSCTGRTTITPGEYDLLPDHAILVNAASGNHELGMDKVEGGPGFLTDDPKETFDERGFRRTTFKGLDVNLGDLAGGEQMFSRVVRGEDGSERLVLKSGYVVNMNEDIPPEFIQLTRALLLAACLQAVDEKAPGLVDLRKDAQDFVVARTTKHVARAGLSLTEPDFRGLAPSES